jgi:hypothetical protein
MFVQKAIFISLVTGYGTAFDAVCFFLTGTTARKYFIQLQNSHALVFRKIAIKPERKFFFSNLIKMLLFSQKMKQKWGFGI